MTITDFLLARIAEDEEGARLALAANVGWYLDAGEVWVLHAEDGSSASGLIDGFPIWADGAGEHIARHDPARVLAECEAKRDVVEVWDNFADPDSDANTAILARYTMSLLALPYADHPNFRPEWRP